MRCIKRDGLRSIYLEKSNHQVRSLLSHVQCVVDASTSRIQSWLCVGARSALWCKGVSFITWLAVQLISTNQCCDGLHVGLNPFKFLFGRYLKDKVLYPLAIKPLTANKKNNIFLIGPHFSQNSTSVPIDLCRQGAHIEHLHDLWKQTWNYMISEILSYVYFVTKT